MAGRSGSCAAALCGDPGRCSATQVYGAGKGGAVDQQAAWQLVQTLRDALRVAYRCHELAGAWDSECSEHYSQLKEATVSCTRLLMTAA